MNKRTPHWGIWGLGTVGKSVIRHLSKRGYRLGAYDTRIVTPEETAFLELHSVKLYSPSEQELFIKEHDVIVPSPGVDASLLSSTQRMAELDLFTDAWKKPLITVTGSLGKTTFVTALDQMLQFHGYKVATGGNIGKAMLDLLELQTASDYGLLEVSSFQLEYARTLAPDFAIWTTLHPNHLDRHSTVDDYFMAKYRMLEQQDDTQKALVPFSLLPKLRSLKPRAYSCFSQHPLTVGEKDTLQTGDIHYSVDKSTLIKITKKSDYSFLKEEISLSYSNNPLHGETWLCLVAASDMLGLTKNATLSIPELSQVAHRIEFVGTYKGIKFYNDSKSTIIESTLAACQKLSQQPVHLLLGGVSKGIDRTVKIVPLKNLVSSITCFGAEARQLSKACTQLGIASVDCSALDEALAASLRRAKAGDIILLSPGGASFDLYKNYEARGMHFKDLCSNLLQT